MGWLLSVRSCSTARTLAATRLADISFIYAGVRDVRLMQGGKAAWVAGLARSRREEACASRIEMAGGLPADFSAIQLKWQTARRSWCSILSVRSWAGSPERPLLPIAARGHIPGARWTYGSRCTPSEDFQAITPCARVRRDGARGITREHTTTLYCGTAWQPRSLSLCHGLG